MFQWKVLRRRLIEIRVQVPLHYSTMKIKISCTSRLSFFLNGRVFYYDVLFFLVTKRVFTRLHSFEQVKTLGALRERWRPRRQKWRRGGWYFRSFSGLTRQIHTESVKTRAFKFAVSDNSVQSRETSNFRLLFMTSGTSEGLNGV